MLFDMGFVAACGFDTSRNLIRGNLNSQLVAFIEVVFSATNYIRTESHYATE